MKENIFSILHVTSDKKIPENISFGEAQQILNNINHIFTQHTAQSISAISVLSSSIGCLLYSLKFDFQHCFCCMNLKLILISEINLQLLNALYLKPIHKGHFQLNLCSYTSTKLCSLQQLLVDSPSAKHPQFHHIKISLIIAFVNSTHSRPTNMVQSDPYRNSLCQKSTKALAQVKEHSTVEISWNHFLLSA